MAVLNHPKPFYLIFTLEFWERFGYYGVMAILVFYFVQQLGYTEEKADIIFGSFSALAYGLIAIGGKIGDSYFGLKRTVMFGAIVLCSGYFLLGLSRYNTVLFFAGLGAIMTGNALFKANPSALLSQCYTKKDPRIDSAFTMYYMAINLGSTTSMLLVPYLAYKYNWSVGFYISTFGLLVCIFLFYHFRAVVHHIGSATDKVLPKSRWGIMSGGVLFSVMLTAWLLDHVLLSQVVLIVAGIIATGYLLFSAQQLSRQDRSRLMVAYVLWWEAIIFYALYAQMPTSLNFFALHFVDAHLFGIPIQAASFQTLNPLWIIVASPVLAKVYFLLAEKNMDLSLPAKFAVGMVCCACGFFILPLAAQTYSSHHLISFWWLVAVYGFQSVGELLISALGLAVMAKLAPANLMGFMMGFWWMTSSYGSLLGGQLAALTATKGTDIAQYAHVFLNIGWWILGIAVVMFTQVPGLKKKLQPYPEESFVSEPNSQTN